MKSSEHLFNQEQEPLIRSADSHDSKDSGNHRKSLTTGTTPVLFGAGPTNRLARFGGHSTMSQELVDH